MVSFIDRYRGEYGVEPICRVLPIAPSTYREHKARQRDRTRLPEREKRDVVLRGHIRRVWMENRLVYGAKKVWKGLLREGLKIARCTVARLMRQMGLIGAVRGTKVKTTIPDSSVVCPLDLVARDFTASRPNELWVSDFTYVSSWSGWVYTSFVIDVFARRIVGWRVSSSMSADLVLDALEQAIWARQIGSGRLVHHSDHGSQYLSIRYSERLSDFDIQPSVGSVGDSYDNALAETVIGLYKTEVINRLGPWRGREHVEMETLEWVSWFNNRRLLEPLGYVPPAEFEKEYYRSQEAQANVAGVK
jgi:transposase InsO family protein